jgi:hypothetical protein
LSLDHSEPGRFDPDTIDKLFGVENAFLVEITDRTGDVFQFVAEDVKIQDQSFLKQPVLLANIGSTALAWVQDGKMCCLVKRGSGGDNEKIYCFEGQCPNFGAA